MYLMKNIVEMSKKRNYTRMNLFFLYIDKYKASMSKNRCKYNEIKKRIKINKCKKCRKIGVPRVWQKNMQKKLKKDVDNHYCA